LQFEPSIRGKVKRLADCRIAGRNDYGDQDQPGNPFADSCVYGVYDAAQPKKRAHPIPTPHRHPNRARYPVAAPRQGPSTGQDCPPPCRHTALKVKPLCALVTITIHALVMTMVVQVAQAMGTKQQSHSSLVLMAVRSRPSQF
jgi:hypothetical protein